MLTEGMYLLDRYEIVSKIGAGGMSDVYKAKDHILGRFVAIKVLKQEFSEDMNFVTKFRTEAQSAAALEHPNIVNIYDVGSENRMHFIVMEYVEGITLKTYIEKKQQLSFKEAVSIAIQVARGIEAAHNKNIIHRDIKPQNIIISTDGKVKVTDFGIARAASSNTISSDVMGSVHYASPEQARNGFVDARSDIYSLGIVMYEMVTGRVPFDGDTTVAVAIQHLQEEMAKPSNFAPNLPISMEMIIIKCAQKNPDRRYQDMAELLMDLRKSLINPDEDFVVIAPPAVDTGKTKVISEEELKQINSEELPESDEEPEDFDEDDSDEDEDDEEGFMNPKMERIMTIGGIAVAVIMVIIIIILIGNVVGLFRFGKKPNAENSQVQTETQSQTQESEAENQVEMIDLKGKTIEEAEAALEAAGYKEISVFAYAYEENSQYKEGQIISQTPEAGDKIAENGTVNVTICGQADNANNVPVPSLEGLTEEAAISTLKNAGLTYEKNFEYSDSIESGKVISQSPIADTKVPKKSTVKIVVSQGVQPSSVPNVVGLDSATAKSNCEAVGLSVKINEKYDETVEAGKVISQNIESGKSVQKGTEITLDVSKGKEQKNYIASYNFQVPEGAVSVTITLTEANKGVAEILENVTLEPGTKTYQFTSTKPLTNPSGSVQATWKIQKTVTAEDGTTSTETVDQVDAAIEIEFTVQ